MAVYGSFVLFESFLVSSCGDCSLLVGHDVFFERQAWWQVVFEVEFSVEWLCSGGASTCESLWGVPTVSFMVLPLLYMVFEGWQVVSWNYWRKACHMFTIFTFTMVEVATWGRMDQCVYESPLVYCGCFCWLGFWVESSAWDFGAVSLWFWSEICLRVSVKCHVWMIEHRTD